MEFETMVRLIERCPVCGKYLETNPIMHGPSCFLHGDFVIMGGEIVFKIMRNLKDREGL
jgi:hypothetical protein